MTIVWVVLTISLMIFESITLNLVSIWFVFGSFVALLSTFITDNYVVQFLVFLGVSTLSLFLTRPIVNKLVKKGHVKTNLDSVIGKYGIVTTKIMPDVLGRVKIQGKDWAAKSSQTIKEGSKVEILNIEGVKLIVKEGEEK